MTKVPFPAFRRASSGLLVLILLSLCLAPLLRGSAEADSAGYSISSYSSEIDVSSANVYSVKETVNADFTSPKHGIIRNIPYIQRMNWNINGSQETITYKTKVSNVRASESFSKYTEDGSVVLKIGDADTTVTGKKIYNISFDQNLGDDKVDAGDFVYYNIIGTGFDCEISNVSFKVTLPKSFDASSLHFYTGAYGSTSESKVDYTVNGNTITGKLNDTLAPGEGLTIQLGLPEGYFTIPEPFPWQNVIIAAAVLLMLLSLLMFLLFGRDPALVRTVEFYPPDDITSAEAGYIIDSSIDNRDVVSLVIYWASKGYLAINEENGLVLKKVRELPDDRAEYEKYMFGQLFYDRNEVAVSALKEHFYTALRTTEDMLLEYYAEDETRLYDRKSLVLRKLTFVFAVLLIGATVFYPVYTSIEVSSLSLIISAVSAVFVMLPLYALTLTLTAWNGLNTMKRVKRLVLDIILSAIVMLIYTLAMLMANQPLLCITAVIASVFLVLMSVLMRKRTRSGNEVLGKLLGFKNFIEVAEKPKLERLVEENPSYFYDVIPYAYVLGVSDKWARKFEGIAMRPPEWYGGSPGMPFTPLIFQQSLFHSMAYMNTAMMATPPHIPDDIGRGGFGGGSFGGGGFGGGFSGGGFGGGGGSSW